MAYILRNEYDGPWKEMGLTPDGWLNQFGTQLVVSEEDILRNAVPYSLNQDGPQDHVVYFLINKDEIIYVGESTNPAQRFIQHWQRGFRFDKYYAILNLPRLYMREYESFYIWRHRPHLNVKYPNLCDPLRALIGDAVTETAEYR